MPFECATAQYMHYLQVACAAPSACCACAAPSAYASVALSMLQPSALTSVAWTMLQFNPIYLCSKLSSFQACAPTWLSGAATKHGPQQCMAEGLEWHTQ